MPTTYTIVSQTNRNKWIDALQTAQEGFDITVRWGNPGTVFTVFVASEAYNATNVDAAIREQGAKVDQVAALGQSPPPPPTAA